LLNKFKFFKESDLIRNSNNFHETDSREALPPNLLHLTTRTTAHLVKLTVTQLAQKLLSFMGPQSSHSQQPTTVHTAKTLFLKGQFTLYVTFMFHHGTSLFSKIFSCVIKRRCSHWQDRPYHVSVLFHHRCQARTFDMTERVQMHLYLLDSDNVNSLTSPSLHFNCLLATSAACFCLEKWKTN
jgi:hypothetical protein